MSTLANPMSAAVPGEAAGLKTRIVSIDLLRGAVMIVMALDHVRDFFSTNPVEPTDLQHATAVLFFTRWITHFCAPTFVFLSGVSAYLSGRRKTAGEAAVFLWKRGAWLILVEAVIVTLGWTFDLAYRVIIFQVIWTIGCSMLLLGLALKLSPRIVPVLGLALVAGHNLTDYFHPGGLGWALTVTGGSTFIRYAPHRSVLEVYTVLPWTGIMMLGYSIGNWFTSDYTQAQRRKKLLRTGSAVIALFLVIRGINTYGDPHPWLVQRNFGYTVLSFLNVSKYPSSLLYTCLTLGPALLVLAFTERAAGVVSGGLQVYGRVPFFYYICHLYLIHLCCVVLFFVTGHSLQDASGTGLFKFHLNTVGFGLGGVYMVWAFIIFLLYFPCRWYDRYKQTHRQHWWLSYL